MNAVLKSFGSSASWLDKPAEKLQALFTPILGEHAPHELKDTLYGVWLGHPLHPLLTDVSIGGWTMSAICDFLGEEEAADITLKIGTLSAVGTALTGAAQWYDATNDDAPRRLGAAHALLNTAALGFYATSIMLRNNNSRSAGVATAWAGHLLSTTSGWIGGHLSFDLGLGVNHQMDEYLPADWTNAIDAEELTDGKAHRVDVEGVPVMLIRQHDEILAISATCPHLSGPLDEGEIGENCVTCPWHASVFDLHTGNVIHGPATSAAHAFQTRVNEGTVQIRAIA